MNDTIIYFSDLTILKDLYKNMKKLKKSFETKDLHYHKLVIDINLDNVTLYLMTKKAIQKYTYATMIKSNKITNTYDIDFYIIEQIIKLDLHDNIQILFSESTDSIIIYDTFDSKKHVIEYKLSQRKFNHIKPHFNKIYNKDLLSEHSSINLDDLIKFSNAVNELPYNVISNFKEFSFKDGILNYKHDDTFNFDFVLAKNSNLSTKHNIDNEHFNNALITNKKLINTIATIEKKYIYLHSNYSAYNNLDFIETIFLP